jgi:hypothetical protein
MTITRETKVGVAVSCTFVCLVGLILGCKLYEETPEEQGTDGGQAGGAPTAPVVQSPSGSGKSVVDVIADGAVAVMPFAPQSTSPVPPPVPPPVSTATSVPAPAPFFPGAPPVPTPPPPEVKVTVAEDDKNKFGPRAATLADAIVEFGAHEGSRAAVMVAVNSSLPPPIIPVPAPALVTNPMAPPTPAPAPPPPPPPAMPIPAPPPAAGQLSGDNKYDKPSPPTLQPPMPLESTFTPKQEEAKPAPAPSPGGAAITPTPDAKLAPIPAPPTAVRNDAPPTRLQPPLGSEATTLRPTPPPSKLNYRAVQLKEPATFQELSRWYYQADYSVELAKFNFDNGGPAETNGKISPNQYVYFPDKTYFEKPATPVAAIRPVAAPPKPAGKTVTAYEIPEGGESLQTLAGGNADLLAKVRALNPVFGQTNEQALIPAGTVLKLPPEMQASPLH